MITVIVLVVAAAMAAAAQRIGRHPDPQHPTDRSRQVMRRSPHH
ncbi:hypothetical protein ABT330_32890 [Streptomyces sp. NPDC000658]